MPCDASPSRLTPALVRIGRPGYHPAARHGTARQGGCLPFNARHRPAARRNIPDAASRQEKPLHIKPAPYRAAENEAGRQPRVAPDRARLLASEPGVFALRHGILYGLITLQKAYKIKHSATCRDLSAKIKPFAGKLAPLSPLPASFTLRFVGYHAVSTWEKASGLSLPLLPTALVVPCLSGRGESVFFNPGAQEGSEQLDPGLAGLGLMLFVGRTAIVRFVLPGPRVVNEAAEAAF